MDAASGGAYEAKSRPRGHWRPEEDERLRQLVEQHRPQNWNFIAEKLQGRSESRCDYATIQKDDEPSNSKRWGKLSFI
ncbi:hypothetical protein EJ110_NYTH47034 [Nymphaea thermarum]|nr:hypothetical protein EJ110_NYTH47034 [Nymphaea thermarum]